MWHRLRTPSLSQTDPGFLSSLSELSQSTLRSLLYTTALVCVAVYTLANVWSSGANVPRVTTVLIPIVACSYLAFAWVARWLRVAVLAWLVGCAASVTLAVQLFQEPVFGYLYLLIPLVATVLVSWPAGVLGAVAVPALAWSLSRYAFFPDWPEAHFISLLIGGAIQVAVGWAVTRSLLGVTAWTLASFHQAQREVAEARNQRVEYDQAQEDLLLANKELARLSDRLKVMYQIAEEARRVKEEFVANVSHELRTPLNMIIGFSEMITQSPQAYSHDLPPALLADITAIQRNSQHLSKLVDDVLSLSQVDAGRAALTREWVSLGEIIDEAVTAVRALYQSKKLYLQADGAPGLPKVFCDSTRIRQVVLNLLSNAGRFTEQGGVRVKAWAQGENMIMSVADTGPGIDPESQVKLFEPFQQLDGSIRRRHGGSGLGLSISKKFVELHGGKMWLESEVGRGTTFYCSLPIERPASAEAVAADKGSRRWFSEYGRYEARTREFKATAPQVPPLLIVLGRGDTLPQLLRAYGDNVEVIAVQDVEQAARELAHSSAQALIVNGASPDELSLLKSKLSAMPFPPPIITCWVPGKDEAARQLGVVRYLVKPVTKEKLLTVVAELGQPVESVLLVDDQPEMLQLFVRMLSSASLNYRVLQATSGRRALALLRERRPDVVLLDLIMPGMDGFQLLQEKSRDPRIKDIPVVAISSRDPSGTPIVTDTLTVTRANGLSARELFTCIQVVSGILAPSAQPADPVRPETLAA